MAQVQKLSAAADIQEIIDILDRNGCLVLTGALTSGILERLQKEIHSQFAQRPFCAGNFFGFSTKRISGVFTKAPATQELAIHPAVLKVMDAFLLKSCREYQINLTQGIQIWPGEPAQIVHTDDLMFPFELPVSGDQKMINCMWAVDDFTFENGATALVPGSHKWPRDRVAQPEEIAYGEMPAGSLLIYFGSLQHGGGANRAQKFRTGLVISYCLGWLRQAENQYLAVSREEARSFPPRLQRLLGYFVHEPNLGAVEGQDPAQLLAKTVPVNENFNEFIPSEYHGVLEEYRKKAIGET